MANMAVATDLFQFSPSREGGRAAKTGGWNECRNFNSRPRVRAVHAGHDFAGICKISILALA